MGPPDTAEKIGGLGRGWQQGEPGPPTAGPARPQLRAPRRGYHPLTYGRGQHRDGEHGHGQVLQRHPLQPAHVRYHSPVRLPPERYTQHRLLRGG